MNRFLKPTTEQVDPSQFAVLRMLLRLLTSRKGPLTRMEANWFVFQTRKYNLSKEQRETLHSDLKARPDVDLLFESVQNQDLDVLQRLLSLAAKIDGKITAEEAAVLAEVQKLIKIRKTNPQDVINQFVADHVRRQEIWTDLQNAGKSMSKQVWYRRFW